MKPGNYIRFKRRNFLRLFEKEIVPQNSFEENIAIRYGNGKADISLNGVLKVRISKHKRLEIRDIGETAFKRHFSIGKNRNQYSVSIGDSSYTVEFVKVINFIGLRQSSVLKDGNIVARLNYVPNAFFWGGSLEVADFDESDKVPILAIATFVWLEKNHLMDNAVTSS